MQHRKYILFIGFLLGMLSIGFNAFAQHTINAALRNNGLRANADTVNLFELPASALLSAKNRFYRAQSLYLQEIGQQWTIKTRSSFLNLIADSVADAAMLSAKFDLQKRGLHLPQQAYSKKNATISTWGFRQIDRVKISGYFSFSRKWEDSLSANLTSLSDGITPYYYFTPKAGTYERQVYKMGMGIGYDIIKNRLYIGTDIDYLYSKSTGSVDPRPEDTRMQVDFSPGLSYQFYNAFIGLSVIKGYGTQDMNISYKNDIFNLGNAYPERNYYLNMGYGSIVLKTPLIADNLQDNQGVALNFSTKLKHSILRGGLKYLKVYQDSRRSPDTILVTDRLARWSMNQYSGWVQLKSKGLHHSSLTQLSWQHQKGHDSNIIFGGRNYFATNNKLRLAYFHSYPILHKGVNKEWGASIEYNEMERKDILAAHYLKLQNIKLGLSGALYFPTANLAVWKLSWTPSLYYPISANASVPTTQVNAFTTNIFYPLIQFQNTVKLQNTVQISYMSNRIIKGLLSGFNLDINYLKALKTLHYNQVRLPLHLKNVNDKRLRLNLAFNIYL